jgi:radical SAM superfamily enzyme with C-terminal helix-hairpin-helix motif
VEYPLKVNLCHITALEGLLGLGRKRATRLFRARPLEGYDDLRKALDDPKVAEAVLPFLSFDLPEH